ncbi:chymotrypsin family serine protease [Ornithinicoccus halotolerans]|uniref:hypothetical protein n=1 Tax=Ornithinicoccus halotolerans TaxID=1748220 RepID=UPI00129605DD|nr:hypothetical protein [Ornithinicoccus halotolerans]
MPEEIRQPSAEEVQRVSAAKSQAEVDLFAIPGVHAVGIGYKRVGGKLTDEVSVVVYVDRKVPEDQLLPGWLVPRSIEPFDAGAEPVRTDVVQRPRAVEYPHLADGSLATRVRPVPGGRSIQGGLGGGTLGGWVWDDLNDGPVLLSNNHVLGGTVGANVYQPWGSTSPADQIADNVRTGTLDATIAAPTDPDHIAYEIEGIAPAVYEITEPVLGMQVEKSGATTEHTTGTIVAIDLSLGHNGSTRDFEMLPDEGQLRMAYYGDSGSLIVERTHPEGAAWRRVVGLLWGGVPSEYNAYAHPISDVFEDLDLTTICSGMVSQLLDNLFVRAPREREFVLPPAARAVEFPRVRPPAHPVQPSRVWPPQLREVVAAPGGRSGRRWGDLVHLPRHRGIARDVEAAIKDTSRGREIAALVQQHRVPLARVAATRRHRRIVQEALEPFLQGLWSPDEVLDKAVTAEDASHFDRALTSLEEVPELAGLTRHARQLLDKAAGRTLREVLRDDQ